jgi:hypothetical protein
MAWWAARFRGLALGCQRVSIDVGFGRSDFIPERGWIAACFAGRGCHVVKALDEYRSPTHKVLALVKKGRDALRVKYRALMEQRRVAENQVRAVEKSRALWRARAEAAEAELSALKKRLDRPA